MRACVCARDARCVVSGGVAGGCRCGAAVSEVVCGEMVCVEMLCGEVVCGEVVIS